MVSEEGEERVLDLITSDVNPLLVIFMTLSLDAQPDEVIQIIANYGLMPSDALIALTCKKYGIESTATLDKDFERVPWLKVV